MECVFTGDIGTSNIKTALVAPDGSIFKLKIFPLAGNRKPSAWVKIIHEALNESEAYLLQNKKKLVAICISGNGPSLVSVSQKEGIEDKLFLWNEKINEENWSEREQELFKKITASGSIFLPRIFTFAKKYPKDFFGARYLFSLPEYLSYKLCGTAATFLPELRYKSAYWSRKTITDIFSSADSAVPEGFARQALTILPEFVPSASLLGTYKNIPLIAGAPDFFAALLGTKTISPFAACDRAGTSEGLNLCVAEKPSARETTLQGLRLLPSVLPKHWNIASLLGETGKFSAKVGSKKSVREIRESFSDDRQFSHFAFQFKNAIGTLEKKAGKKLDFVLTGGQAENNIWNQFKAELSGRRFFLAQTTACELLGDAVLAFCALGFFSTPVQACNQLVKITEVFEPSAIVPHC